MLVSVSVPVAALFAVMSLTVEAFNTVAIRAVSPLLPDRRMAQVLAGERQMDAVCQEAYRLRCERGSYAAASFLETLPTEYLRKSEMIESIIEETSIQQLVILDSKMDTRAYELTCLSSVDVVEIEEKGLISVKECLIQSRGSHIPLLARSITRVSSINAVDFTKPTLIVADRILRVRLCPGSAFIYTTSRIKTRPGFKKVLVHQVSKERFQVSAWLSVNQ